MRELLEKNRHKKYKNQIITEDKLISLSNVSQ